MSSRARAARCLTPSRSYAAAAAASASLAAAGVGFARALAQEQLAARRVEGAAELLPCCAPSAEQVERLG